MRKPRLISIVTLLLVTSFLTACSPQVRIAWAGSSFGNQMDYSYRTFTGTEAATVNADAGQSLAVDYSVTVEKGTLSLRIVGPEDEVLWEEEYRDDASGETSLVLAEAGAYRIGVEGEDTGGSFDIVWQLTQ